MCAVFFLQPSAAGVHRPSMATSMGSLVGSNRRPAFPSTYFALPAPPACRSNMEGGGKQKNHGDKNWDLQVGRHALIVTVPGATAGAEGGGRGSPAASAPAWPARSRVALPDHHTMRRPLCSMRLCPLSGRWCWHSGQRPRLAIRSKPTVASPTMRLPSPLPSPLFTPCAARFRAAAQGNAADARPCACGGEPGRPPRRRPPAAPPAARRPEGVWAAAGGCQGAQQGQQRMARLPQSPSLFVSLSSNFRSA